MRAPEELSYARVRVIVRVRPGAPVKQHVDRGRQRVFISNIRKCLHVPRRRHGLFPLLREPAKAWRNLPNNELVMRIGMSQPHPWFKLKIALDAAANRVSSKHDAVRIHPVAGAPAHGKIERVEEAISMRLDGAGKSV
jgi:hypothetical protein